MMTNYRPSNTGEKVKSGKFNIDILDKKEYEVKSTKPNKKYTKGVYGKYTYYWYKKPNGVSSRYRGAEKASKNYLKKAIKKAGK